MTMTTGGKRGTADGGHQAGAKQSGYRRVVLCQSLPESLQVATIVLSAVCAAPAATRRPSDTLRLGLRPQSRSVLVAASPRCAVSQSCTLRGVVNERRVGPTRGSAESN